MKIRKALPFEHKKLTDLALTSKAYWGYSNEFIEQCKPALTVTSEDLDNNSCYFDVYEIDDVIVGFYGLEFNNSSIGDLVYLFVHPDSMGLGIGKKLFQAALDKSREQGLLSIEILSDPGAKGFYIAQGAEFREYRQSDVIKGRQLPYLVYRVRALELA